MFKALSKFFDSAPRMALWAVMTVLLLAAAMVLQAVSPSSLVAVTAYKLHLMALAGWGGYWLDRALFPYDRPHQYVESEPADPPLFSGEIDEHPGNGTMAAAQVLPSASVFGATMVRRAIIVAACLICVGLGA